MLLQVAYQISRVLKLDDDVCQLEVVTSLRDDLVRGGSFLSAVVTAEKLSAAPQGVS